MKERDNHTNRLWAITPDLAKYDHWEGKEYSRRYKPAPASWYKDWANCLIFAPWSGNWAYDVPGGAK